MKKRRQIEREKLREKNTEKERKTLENRERERKTQRATERDVETDRDVTYPSASCLLHNQDNQETHTQYCIQDADR